MDFCLHVVVFGLGMVYHQAICFHTEAERVRYSRDLTTQGVVFVAQYQTREELEVSYRIILNE